jgi:hypothetical protein
MGAAQLRRYPLYECTPKLAVQPCAEEESLYNGAARNGVENRPTRRSGWAENEGLDYFFSAAAFLHSARNFLRSLP